jgi:ABC-type multidrug transport system ATPase subunit
VPALRRRWALVDVSFDLAAGSALMIAGRNGSGKSTLLRLLATAIRPDRGSARVAGHDLREARDQVRRNVALLSHHSYHYEALSALENLQVAARFLGKDAGRPALLTLLEQLPWPTAPTIPSTRFRPACASASRSRARCCRTRAWCCSTSPTASWTRPAFA